MNIKKKISLAAFLLAAGMATGQNALTVDNFTLPQNGGMMTVTLTLDEADVYTSYQFKIETPAGMGYVLDSDGDAECTLGIGHQSTHGATAHWTESSRLLTVGVVSTKSALLTGQTVVLGIPMAATTADVGTTHDFTITGINFIKQENATKVALNDVSFTVTIGEPADPRTILDENSTTVPDEAENVNVRVNRTLKAGVWSTICLPFAMTEDQTKAAFGEDVELGDFEGIISNYDTDEETILSIQVNFSQATSIESNHPYLIKVDDNISSFTVDNVDIAPEEETSVDKDEYRTGSGTKKDPFVYHYNSFIGTYVADFTVPELCLFLNGNKFWYSMGNTKMKAFRAYFDFYDVLTEVEESAAPQLTLSFDGKGGDVTKIDGRTMEQIETGRVYNTAGQYVGESENINQLPKGVYIVNGKKKVIK